MPYDIQICKLLMNLVHQDFYPEYYIQFYICKDLLLFIANEMNNNRFGTFLGSCEKDRVALKLRSETVSMWTYILLNKNTYINIHYDEDLNMKQNEGIMKQIPVTSHFCLVEWRQLFYKWCEWGNVRPEKKTKDQEEIKIEVEDAVNNENDAAVPNDFEMIDDNEECNISNISE